jgi:hypothetical protein
MQPGDVIGVLHADDIPGRTLLFFLQKLTGNRRDIRVVAIPGGITGKEYREIARSHEITKLAVATTLEDAAAAALTGILQGKVGEYLSPVIDTAGLPSPVTPFGHIPAGEVMLYARACGITGNASSGRKEVSPMHAEVAAMMNVYSQRHPAAPHAVLNLCEVLARTCRKADEVFTDGS